ncbi:hypothetical protein FYC62_04760 [Pedobacter aquae]|uniref:Uncharacterized protein n=1 Tax=Pedobacter aquae TaxID=2605747 RepID=A0A5C0VIP0_9SPHI|nr:hypothetical protein [Pedobacter aquae]QEK51060.1 hypothetical protein FYC62_04760 [Pedobacter aquae]
MKLKIRILLGLIIFNLTVAHAAISVSPLLGDHMVLQRNSTVLQIAGGTSTALSNQVWAVSNAVNLTRVKPDVGVALKNMSSRLDEYTFVYTQPGTYKVAFEAFNINVYGESRAIKELEVNVVAP